jgi:hypothetical protein
VKDPNGKIVDLQKSFLVSPPSSTYTYTAILLSKVVLWGLTVSNLVYGWIDTEYPGFHMAYLSHWGLLIATLYQTMSLLVSAGIFADSNQYLLHLTWVMFSLAAGFEMIVALLYWFLDYDPDENELDFQNLMTHAIVLVLVLIDGLVLNRTPVRMKHYLVTLVFAIFYIVWTVIHAFVVERNPYSDDEVEYPEISIYSSFDWNNDLTDATILSAEVCFIVLPIFHLVTWAMSYAKRRYKQEEEGDAIVPAGEEGDAIVPAGEEGDAIVPAGEEEMDA